MRSMLQLLGIGWILVAMCAWGCALKKDGAKPIVRANGQTSPIMPDANRVRVACVGDSITFGAGLSDPNTQSYPAQLQKLLGAKYQVANFGHNGATASSETDKPYMSLPEFQDALHFQPNIVIILLGTNDAAPKNWPRVKDRFEADYVRLIQQFESLPTNPRIIVCLPPPAPGNEREPTLGEEVSKSIADVSKRREGETLDLRTSFSQKEALFPDGLHPNAVGAQRIAERVSSAITQVTNASNPTLPKRQQ